MVFIFIGFIGVLVSSSVNEFATFYGYVWKDISVNAYGIFMTFVAIGIMRMMRVSVGRVKRSRFGGERRRRSRRGERRARRSESGMERILMQNRLRQIKLYAAWVVVCMVTTLVSTFLLNADLRTSIRAMGSFVMFGSTDPYMAPRKIEKLKGEMKEAMIEIMK